MPEMSRRLFLKISGGALVASQIAVFGAEAVASIFNAPVFDNPMTFTMTGIPGRFNISVFLADNMQRRLVPLYNDRPNCRSMEIQAPKDGRLMLVCIDQDDRNGGSVGWRGTFECSGDTTLAMSGVLPSVDYDDRA